MKKLVLLIFAQLPLLLFAQPFTIQGSVVDADSKKAIEGAFVFINQSSTAVFTGKDGRYSLENLPEKAFEVVVSMKGYLPLTYRAAPLKPLSAVKFELVKDTDTLYDKDGWNKYGRVFLYNFIGTSKNSSWCEILNPEVLRFNYNDSIDELTVTSNGCLQIANEALGYLMNYHLDSFRLSTTHKYLFTNGYVSFKNLTTKRQEIIDRWQFARQETYKGSWMHFFRSLYANKVVAEGFDLHNLKLVFEDEPGYTAAKKTKEAMLFNKGTAMKGGGMKNYVYMADKKILPVDSIRIVNAGKYLYNYKGILQVIYKRAKEEADYFLLVAVEKTAGFQTSFFESVNSIWLQQSGMCYDAKDLNISGYMNWKKVCELLPYDYVDQ